MPGGLRHKDNLTFLHELKKRKGRYGVGGACIGGGQGIALLVEAL
ncbi:MAG: hypothetical protein HYT78_16570 [Deltaproteobacteria bacterium]|nr:hypothetical protein [Deltaproteobacteria bacterium]